jgi:hypothetical protein
VIVARDSMVDQVGLEDLEEKKDGMYYIYCGGLKD